MFVINGKHSPILAGSKGGEVHVIKTGQQTQFIGTEKNKIASKDKLSSYDSFKFEGKQPQPSLFTSKQARALDYVAALIELKWLIYYF